MKKYKENHNIYSKEPVFEHFKVFIAWVGMVLVPMIYIFSDAFYKFGMNLDVKVRLAGIVLMAASLILFYYVHKKLDNNWSPVLEIKENQKLITTGIYSHIRHPMYTQCWVWVFCQGIAAANWFVLIFGLVSWGFLYFTRVSNEEKMMTEQFGDEYIEYMKRTGRLLPRF